MWNVTGVSGAAPAWAEIMEALHQTGKDVAPKAPRGIIRAQGEWYIRGTEPSSVLAEADEKPSQQAKIIYPVEGLMVARDPDIPIDHQRIFFEANSRDPSSKWVLNNKDLASAGDSYPWQPGVPGNYELKLISSSGKVLDQVHFLVRR